MHLLRVVGPYTASDMLEERVGIKYVYHDILRAEHG